MTTVAIPSAGETLAAGVALIPVSIFVVGLRFAARRHRGTPLRVDDWLMVPALLGALGVCAILIWGVVTESLGHATPQPKPGENPLTFQSSAISTAKIAEWAMYLIQCVSLACTKISCLVFYRRVFDTGHNRWFHHLSTILIVFTAIWGVTFFIALLAECPGHISAWWTDIETLNEYCGPAFDIEIAFAVTDTTADLLVLITPMLVIAPLRMSRARKLAVATLFGIGGLTVAASITRMIVFVQVIAALRMAYKSSGANDSLVTVAVYWGTLESGLALTVACLPVFYSTARDFLRHALSRLSGRPPPPDQPHHHTNSRPVAAPVVIPSHTYTSKQISFPVRNPRRWPLSHYINLSTSKMSPLGTVGAHEPEPSTPEDWSYLNDRIPMIARPPGTAQIETRAVGAAMAVGTSPESITPKSEKSVGLGYAGAATPESALGGIRVKRSIDQDVHIV